MIINITDYKNTIIGIKNFIDKAEKLSLIYHKKRHYAKEKFVKELITCQHRNPLFESIVGCEIITDSSFQKRTIESVCNDLGYNLVEFYRSKQIDGQILYPHLISFTFVKQTE